MFTNSLSKKRMDVFTVYNDDGSDVYFVKQNKNETQPFLHSKSTLVGRGRPGGGSSMDGFLVLFERMVKTLINLRLC